MSSSNPYHSENLILKLTFQFAPAVVEYCESLEEERKFVIARQLLKSGTSIGANVRGAQNADFIHKLKIAVKEADETEYWIQLCAMSPSYPGPNTLQQDLTSISKVLNKIISSSKRGADSPT